MTEEFTRIRVGSHSIALIGWREVLEEVARTHKDRSDEEVREAMLERLARRNYIPPSARERYGEAFLREFRKFLGRPVDEEESGGMTLRILGRGCARCDRLAREVMELLSELSLEACVEHVTDFKEIAQAGVLGTPALMVNGKVVAVGSIPSRARLREWLFRAAEIPAGGSGKEAGG